MMNNSTDGPLSCEPSISEGSFSDVEGCDVNEIDECDDAEVYHNKKYLEMFHRAIKERNQDAQRWLERRFRAMLINWIHAHPGRDQACQLHPEEYFVSQAFRRCWQTSIQDHGFEFKSAADVLHYLRVCLNAAILDALRNYSRSAIARLEKSFEVSESFSNDDNGNRAVWSLIEEKLSDARKRHLAFLLFHYALRPVEIVRSYPQDFSDVEEVSRMRRDIMELLAH